MDEREAIKSGTIISLFEEGTDAKVQFEVLYELNRGSSMICYQVRRTDSKRLLILKEYYPQDALYRSFSLERDKNNQLITPKGNPVAKKNYVEAKSHVCQKHIDLREAINCNEDVQILRTFIPEFKLYFSKKLAHSPKYGNVGTVYFVTDQPELKTFEDYCQEVYKSPQEDSQYKLLTILRVIEHLTVCINALHSAGAGFFHRDINPRNFGFSVRGDILPETISLFDTGTIVGMRDDIKNIYRTDGFAAPEVDTGYSVQSDLFSIGATLFYALSDKGETYKDDTDINKHVESSKLVKAVLSNSDPYLVRKISYILKNTLAHDASERYRECNELLKDIRIAISYLLPQGMKNKIINGREWRLTKIEFSKLERRYYKYKMLYQLYNNPLYRYVGENDKCVRVTMVGFDRYCHDFLDSVLQLGQCISKPICVDVYANLDKDDSIDEYLDNRPALNEFFEVDKDGTLLTGFTDADSYGSIKFYSIEKIDKSSVKNIFKHDYKTNYMYVSLGSEEVNRECSRFLKEQYGNTCVSYVSLNANDNEDNNGIYPVCVNKVVKDDPRFADIEDKAEIRNLLHDRGIYVDIEKKRQSYHADNHYKHNSCVSGVMSLKYILYDLGIDIDSIGSAEHVSDLFIKVHKQKKNKLIYVEHKRWVTEKICDGWTTLPIDEYDKYTINGENKDKVNKRHSCIVRSSVDNKSNILAKEYKHSVKKWDDDADPFEMDDLDRVSLELHRSFMRAAKDEHRIKDIRNNLKDIEYRIVNKSVVYRVFVDWKHCIQTLIAGGKNPVERYESLRDEFNRIVYESELNDLGKIEQLARNIDKSMKCVIQYNKFLNYKYEDEKIFNNLPFILNYSLRIKLGTEFKDDIFANIAPILIVNPEEVYFFVCYSDGKSQKTIDDLKFIVRFLKTHHYRCKFNVLVFCKRGDSIDLFDDSIERIEVSHSLTYYDNEKYRTIKEAIRATKNDLKSKGVLIEGKHDDYTFDVDARKFEGSPRLKYITNHLPNFAVSDVLNASTIRYDYDVPSYYENFDAMWEWYFSRPYISNRWNNFTEKYSVDNGKTLLSIKKELANTGRRKSVSFLFPLECKTNVIRISRFLFETKILSVMPTFSVIASNVFQLSQTQVPESCLSDINNLFSNPTWLLEEKALHFVESSKELSIVYKNLRFTRNLNSNRSRSIVEELNKWNMVDFVDADGFTCTSYEAYDLITQSGRMLEILVYYALKTSGLFDDVVSGAVAHWKGKDLNEMDIIVTKGFRCAIIECKAMTTFYNNDIGKEYYKKLINNSNRMSVKCKPIMVVLCGEYPDETVQSIIEENTTVTTITSINKDKYSFAKEIYKYLTSEW